MAQEQNIHKVFNISDRVYGAVDAEEGEASMPGDDMDMSALQGMGGGAGGMPGMPPGMMGMPGMGGGAGGPGGKACQ